MKKNITYRNSEGLPGGPNRVETLVNAFFQAQMAPFMTPKFPDGGEFTYKGRPDSLYKKEGDVWLIKNADTNGKYVPIKDPTGKRTEVLNKQAVPKITFKRDIKDQGYEQRMFDSISRTLPSESTNVHIPNKYVQVKNPIENIDYSVKYNQRVAKQNQIAQSLKPAKPYAIVDKNVDSIFYFNPSGSPIAGESIITGASNNDIDRGMSMREWMSSTGNTNHDDYFAYLKANNAQTTPSGAFTLGTLRTNTATDPSLLGRTYNNTFRPERAQNIRDMRIRDYGPKQMLFPIINEQGVGSSKALHGTGNEERIKAFNTPGASRALSNGCINVNGQSVCFDVLGKGSGLFILPEESQSLINPTNPAFLKRLNNKQLGGNLFPDGGPVNTYKWGEINEGAFTGGVGLNSEKFDLDLYGSYPLNVRERQFLREEGIKLPGNYEANASYRFNPKFNINAGAAYNYGQPSYNINTGYNKGPFNINAGASFNRGQLPSYNLGLGYDNDKVNFNAGIDLQNGNPYYNAGVKFSFEDGGATHTYNGVNYKKVGTPKTYEIELDDDAIEYYKSLGYKVEYSEGGDVISQHGWDYKKEGDNYFTKRAGTENWITAKGTALDAIKSKVYNENTQQPLVTPKVTPEDGQYIQNFNPQIKSDKNSTIQLQQKLVDAGYNIGNYGSEKNGVDGRIGPKTLAALNAYKTGVSPSQFGTEQIKIKNTPQGTIKIKDTETLPDGFLPVLNDYNTSEKCIEGKKCSYNTSVKMGNLFSGTGALESASQVWAQDAWFNRDQQIRDGGTLIYSTDERDMSKMPKLPKELYSKLQIGDYVHLNRAGRPYEGDVKGNLKNEKLEHVGFIIGKDKDGTPLVWHGSEKGTAYIQRIDGLINLPDHANPVTAPDGLVYQVASVVRNPNLKEFNEKTKANIENMEMFKEFNSNIKLKPTENSTSTQKEAFEVINNNMKNFKMNGYDQEDLAKVGQLLTGGIMQMESEGNEGSGYWYRKFVKEPAAAMVKSAGYKKAFERDEASTGVYQMKTDYNFTNKDGSLNPLGIKLQKLGVDVNDLYWNIEDQTIAGSLILLENLKALRQQENYDPKTKTYKGIPESYILAKTWQAGSGWQNREKYQFWLDHIDITYSENALDFAKNTVGVEGAPSLADDYEKIMKMSAEANKINIDPQALENLKKQKEAKQKLYETDPEAYYQNELSGQFGPQVSESTSVNIPKTTYPVIKPVAKPVVKAPVKKAPVKKPELVLQKKPQRDLPKALVSDNTNVNTSNYLPVQKFSFNKGGTVEDLYDYIYNSI